MKIVAILTLFIISNDPKQVSTSTWNEGNMQCSRGGGGMLFVHPGGSLDDLRGIVSGPSPVWVAGRRAHTSWTWTDGVLLYEYTGCFAIPVTVTLKYSGIAEAFDCFRKCESEYAYAVINEDRCACLDYIGNLSQSNNSTCTYSCPRNFQETCGGPGHVSVYRRSARDYPWGDGISNTDYADCGFIAYDPQFRKPSIGTAECEETNEFKPAFCQNNNGPRTTTGFYKDTRYLQWIEACIQDGAVPAHITTADNLGFINSPYTRQVYWIGLRRKTTWQWIDGRSAMADYGQIQSTDNHGDCLAAYEDDSEKIRLTTLPCQYNAIVRCDDGKPPTSLATRFTTVSPTPTTTTSKQTATVIPTSSSSAATPTNPTTLSQRQTASATSHTTTTTTATTTTTPTTTTTTTTTATTPTTTTTTTTTPTTTTTTTTTSTTTPTTTTTTTTTTPTTTTTTTSTPTTTTTTTTSTTTSTTTTKATTTPSNPPMLPVSSPTTPRTSTLSQRQTTLSPTDSPSTPIKTSHTSSPITTTIKQSPNIQGTSKTTLITTSTEKRTTTSSITGHSKTTDVSNRVTTSVPSQTPPTGTGVPVMHTASNTHDTTTRGEPGSEATGTSHTGVPVSTDSRITEDVTNITAQPEHVSPPTDNNGSSTQQGLYIGLGVVGAILVLAILLLIIAVFSRNYKSGQSKIYRVDSRTRRSLSQSSGGSTSRENLVDKELAKDSVWGKTAKRVKLQSVKEDRNVIWRDENWGFEMGDDDDSVFTNPSPTSVNGHAGGMGMDTRASSEKSDAVRSVRFEDEVQINASQKSY